MSEYRIDTVESLYKCGFRLLQVTEVGAAEAITEERDQLRAELDQERGRVKELERAGRIILAKIQTNLNAISVVDANDFASALSAGEGSKTIYGGSAESDADIIASTGA